jgi:hypothetical protein
MGSDLFEQLDKELASMQQEVAEDATKLTNKRRDVTKSLIENFWQIWIRFKNIDVHFTMEPSPSVFATFEEFPDKWKLKDNFNYALVNGVNLIDRTQAQGRVGDALKAFYYQKDGSTRLRCVFEYCEGEQYYKYSGWKRIFSQQILFDGDIEKTSFEKLWAALAPVIKVWFESHLRKNRDVMIQHVKENFEKGETFTQ